MQGKWLIGFFLALGILILIGVLGEPVGAMLGILVLFSGTTFAVVFSHLVFVRQRTALIVQSALHDAVLRVVTGPDRTFLLPFLEKAGPVLETGYRLEQVHVQDVLQYDQQPATLRFTTFVLHQLAPHTLSPTRLGEILPNLTENLSAIVQRHTDYCLRNLVADLNPDQIHNGSRGRLERHLELLLKERLAVLGIAVQSVQLVIWPPAGLHETLTRAHQHRVGITLQAAQLDALLKALANQADEARSLARLELARSLGRNSQVWTTFDLASFLGGIAIGPDRTPPLASPQVPLGPEFTGGGPLHGHSTTAAGPRSGQGT